MESERSHILIVDDEPSIVRLLETVLKRQFDVDTAPNGSAALQKIEHEPDKFAAILADHNMPGLTGVELLHQAIDISPRAARILVTATDNIEDLRDAVNLARVHRFVIKPLRPIELPRTVESAIHEVTLVHENSRLVAELEENNQLLTKALAQVQAHERHLERVVQQRTQELRETMEELQKLALLDGLTGLYNHRFFQEALTTELARAARYKLNVGLVLLDVDHFKIYNDTNGHPAGDRLLKQLAQILSDSGQLAELRFRGRVSDIAARYGGEEFVVILPQTDKAGAAIRAERIRETVAAYQFENRDKQPLGTVTVSIGVSAFPDDALTKQALIEAADQALYRAKHEGRNQVKLAVPLFDDED